MKNLFSIIIFILITSYGKNQNLEEVSINLKIPTERFIIHKNFPSKYVIERNIEVWLPDDYDNIDALPVLYMLDGQNIFHGKKDWGKDTYNHGWQVDETLDSLFDIGVISEMIVVGIFHTGVKRYSEYMPAQPAEEIKKHLSQSEKWFQNSYKLYGITSDNFLKFIVKELMPFINTNYKTIKEKNSTFIAGSSMGGLISAYAICEYPNIFGGAACISTHWTLLDGYFIKYLKDNLPNPENHKIYFDYGTLGEDSAYEPYQLKVDSLMISIGYKRNINWITKKFEGDKHHEDSWRKRFHYPITFFLN